MRGLPALTGAGSAGCGLAFVVPAWRPLYAPLAFARDTSILRQSVHHSGQDDLDPLGEHRDPGHARTSRQKVDRDCRTKAAR